MIHEGAYYPHAGGWRYRIPILLGLFTFQFMSNKNAEIITNTDNSRGSKSLAASVCVCVCVCDSVCMCLLFCVSVCPHVKTKTAGTKIAKFGTRIVYHESTPRLPINIRSEGQRSPGHKMQKGDRVRRELCTLSSAQPLVS